MSVQDGSRLLYQVICDIAAALAGAWAGAALPFYVSGWRTRHYHTLPEDTPHDFWLYILVGAAVGSFFALVIVPYASDRAMRYRRESPARGLGQLPERTEQEPDVWPPAPKV